MTEEILSWFKKLGFTDKEFDKSIFITRESDVTVRIEMYSINHIFNIVAKKTKDYIGCTVVTREPRDGEDWNRGNDLLDGKYNYRTFVNILKDIIRYEESDGEYLVLKKIYDILEEKI